MSDGKSPQAAEPREHALIHEILPVGLLQCNCHIVGDAVTGQALVIDPGDEVERILTALGRHHLTARAILITHAHIDHVGGMARLRQATGAPVLMHPSDLALYRMLPEQAAWLGASPPARCEVDELLRDGQVVRCGEAGSGSESGVAQPSRFELRVLHTPGHSQGSVSLYLPREAANGAQPEPNWLFAGDTLFAGSIGRTDLWGGSTEQIMHSIEGKLLALPDETIVFPGHGPASTIGEERATNPFLRSL
jgi:hydroxyacylglutathione hydrolase